MSGRTSSLRLKSEPPSRALGLLVAASAVMTITAIIYPLREVSPVVANGVLYLLAVLLVSTVWGLWLGLFTGIASALAFNFFHIPPTAHLRIADSRDWAALAVFLVAAVVASSISDLARSRANEAELRRREADLAADMARLLLGGPSVQEALGAVSGQLARALGLASAAIELREALDGKGRLALPLSYEGRRLGTMLVPDDLPVGTLDRLRERVQPALEALLAAALDRESLQSEVVEARALRRSDEMKTALLRTVSHDLRSPLTAIVATADALSSPAIKVSERKDLAAAVSAEAKRLADLVDKLLDLSRLQAGFAAPRQDWCSVEEIVRAAVEHAASDGATFTLSIDRDLPLIRADAIQLERAIANLLENAARYSGDNPVSVRARVVGPNLCIRIVDRGPGIPEQDLERIFEPFFRSRTQLKGHTGSGLGLAIVKGFVEANSGRVWAESHPSQATVFVIELPVDEHPAAPVGNATPTDASFARAPR